MSVAQYMELDSPALQQLCQEHAEARKKALSLSYMSVLRGVMETASPKCHLPHYM